MNQLQKLIDVLAEFDITGTMWMAQDIEQDANLPQNIRTSAEVVVVALNKLYAAANQLEREME